MSGLALTKKLHEETRRANKAESERCAMIDAIRRVAHFDPMLRQWAISMIDLAYIEGTPSGRLLAAALAARGKETNDG